MIEFESIFMLKVLFLKSPKNESIRKKNEIEIE
jgi:hypothetical protein